MLIMLSTSFIEYELVVCKPEEALARSLRTKRGILVMKNYTVVRNG